MFFPIILLVVGIFFLLKNLGFVGHNSWGVLWPLLIMAFAMYLILRRKRKPWWYRLGMEMKKFGKEFHEENDED